MLIKTKTISLPVYAKDISSLLRITIADDILPVGILGLTDFIVHHHGCEDSCTDFYSVLENHCSFITAKNLGRLWHSGYLQDDHHFDVYKNIPHQRFYGGFYHGGLSFIDSPQSTYSPSGQAFASISLSKFYIRGNEIPSEIKSKVETVNKRILTEKDRLTLIQQSKGFKYGWISYKLQDFMGNYRQEVEKLFENELYFYFPQSPVYQDRYNSLPMIDRIKYTAA
jgi:hypothetical protein